jgi:hypothetical protein
LKKTNINSISIQDFGIAISIIGVPLGMYFNYLFPFIIWSPIFMMLSVVLIFNYKNLFLLKFPSQNSFFKLILSFQILMIVYGYFSLQMTSKNLSFHLYMIFLILSLASCSKKCINNNVLSILFIISSFCSILGLYCLVNGLVVGEDAWELKQEDDFYALEPFTISVGAIYNLSCALYLKSKISIFKYLIYVFILIDFYIILFCGKRTPMFVSLVIVVVFFFKSKGLFNLNNIIHILFGVGIAFFIINLLNFNLNILSVELNNFFSNFFSGIHNLFGDTSVKDDTGSAIHRFQSREWAYNFINNRFDFSNYIFGAGYNTKWLDNPVLQSYLDMGIIGLVFYIYIVIVYPIKVFLNKKSNFLILFAFSICLYNILSSINSGNPYLYIKYMPVVFLSYFTNYLNPKDSSVVKINIIK